MPLTVSLEEEYQTSRPIAIDDKSFNQDFTFFLCGNFEEEADIDPTYGLDDDIVALRAAYSLIPPVRSMPLYDGDFIVLTLKNLKLSQISGEVWKLEVSYGAPDTGGQGPGGNNQDPGDIGPQVGDYQQWSNNYVQVSVNFSSEMEMITQSYGVMSCRKNVNAPNQTVPYPFGRPAPIGQSEDGVEGINVPARSFSFSLTAYRRPSELTIPYVRQIYRMGTTVNSKTFFGLPAGSVLFSEAEFSGDVYSVVPITFHFRMKPNFRFTRNGNLQIMALDKDNPSVMFDIYPDPYFPDDPENPIQINPGADPGNELYIPGTAFSGWDVVDYRYAAVDETDSKTTVQQPILRVVHSVMQYSDFSYLGL